MVFGPSGGTAMKTGLILTSLRGLRNTFDKLSIKHSHPRMLDKALSRKKEKMLKTIQKFCHLLSFPFSFQETFTAINFKTIFALNTTFLCFFV